MEVFIKPESPPPIHLCSWGDMAWVSEMLSIKDSYNPCITTINAYIKHIFMCIHSEDIWIVKLKRPRSFIDKISVDSQQWRIKNNLHYKLIQLVMYAK